jgi:hypothetical protein
MAELDAYESDLVSTLSDRLWGADDAKGDISYEKGSDSWRETGLGPGHLGSGAEFNLRQRADRSIAFTVMPLRAPNDSASAEFTPLGRWCFRRTRLDRSLD